MDSPLGQQYTLSSPSMVRHWEQILVVSEIVFNDICPQIDSTVPDGEITFPFVFHLIQHLKE